MVQLGVEVLLESRIHLISGKRIGLVTNYNVTDSKLNPIISLFNENRSWKLTKLFGPEHGLSNCAKEGEDVASGTDPQTGLPMYSLFGETYKPTSSMLSGLDALVIDLPDVGCRYYTNMSTVCYCLEACAENNLLCIVLDRPNPLGGARREGNLLDEQYKSFVGALRIPNRHGLTMAELANLYNHKYLENRANLEVVKCEGLERWMTQKDTGLPFVSPSPNLSSPDMVALYPGTCFFEGTNISEGRGTPHPFETIGAPFVNAFELANAFNARKLEGVVARPTYFVPTYKKHIGLVCEGIQLHVTDANRLLPFEMGLHLVDLFLSMYPNDFQFINKDREGRYFFDLLAGTDRLRQLCLEGRPLTFLDECQDDLKVYEEFTADVLLYEG